MEVLERRSLLSVFTVTTVADTGPGSLRQAILSANATSVADEIRFDIPGPAGTVRTIRPASPLPAVTQTATIDATTQPGYAGSPLVELDGSEAGLLADGLVVADGATSSVVRGLAVNRFDRDGIVMAARGGRVEANYVGTTAAGDLAASNGGCGVVVRNLEVVVGGPSASQRNVISGNGSAGVWVLGPSYPELPVRIEGNHVGTDPSGTRPLGNGREGVRVGDHVRGVHVGGTAPGAGNLISGNGSSGVYVGPDAAVTIQGNRIGTNSFGATAVPNGRSVMSAHRDGVTSDRAFSLVVGGPDAPARNLISGNMGAGVAVLGRNNAQVWGNLIGTDAAGDAPVGNLGDGVFFGNLPPETASGSAYAVGNVISGNSGNGVRVVSLSSAASFNVNGNFIGTNATGSAPLGNARDGVLVEGGFARVGHTNTGIRDAPAGLTGRNIISANGGHGVHAVGASVGVSNNHIGTNVTGTVGLGNGGHGVFFESSSGDVGVGATGGCGCGSSGGVGNLISANRGNGILVTGPTGGSGTRSGVGVRSNRIGTGASGSDVSSLGNGGHGVSVINANAVAVGGIDDSRGPTPNTIAFNGGSGVFVDGMDSGSSSSNPQSVLILRNSIFSNARLGIDLAGDDPANGVTPNDPGDADRGPNTLLNYPVIRSAITRPDPGGGTTVRASVTAGASRIEFFSSSSPDPSGFGEGSTFLGFATVPTDFTSSGGVLTAELPAVPVGTYVTATASTGSVTSEFSPAVPVGAGPAAPAVGQYVANPSSRPAVVLAGRRALRPGEAPAFDHITGASGGIIGIALDGYVLRLPHMVTRSDFSFRLGTPASTHGGVTWSAATVAPFAVQTETGPGGSDRILFDLRSLPVQNRWLEVRVMPGQRTGLARSEVFYFGNLVGETGDPSSPLHVTALDVAAVKRALGTADPALMARYDFNGDGAVGAFDVAAVKANLGRRLGPPVPVPVPVPVTLIPPGPVGAEAAEQQEGVWEALLREEWSGP